MATKEFNPYQFVFKQGHLDTHMGWLHRKIPVTIANWADSIDVPDRIMSYIPVTSNLANIEDAGTLPKFITLFGWYRMYPGDENVIMLSAEFLPEEERNAVPTFFLGYYILRWKDYLRFIGKSDRTTVIFSVPKSIEDSVVVKEIDIETDIKNKQLYQMCELLKANLITAGLNMSIIGDDPI